jgi:ribosome maturation factor RimP
VSAIGALEDVRDLAEAIASRRSLMLWDVELEGPPGRRVLRVFIEAQGGVDLDTVAEVSEELSRGLDLRDPIEGRYTLEVSSPGLERTLKTPEHFAHSLGKKVMVKTSTPLPGGSHRIDGVLAGAGEESVAIDAGGDRVEVPYAAIKHARTVFEW